MFLAILVAIVLVGRSPSIVFFERGQRRIPIQYAKRMVGRQMYGGQRTHLPLRVNTRRRHPADLRVLAPDVPEPRSPA